jgi:hypothetical protein
LPCRNSGPWAGAAVIPTARAKAGEFRKLQKAGKGPSGIATLGLVSCPSTDFRELIVSAKAQGARLGKEPKKGEAYFVWERVDLLALQDRIDAKDKAKLKGGQYKRYILVICTDEMFLEATKVERWLTGATFRARRIRDVVLGLSYEPAQK